MCGVYTWLSLSLSLLPRKWQLQCVFSTKFCLKFVADLQAALCYTRYFSPSPAHHHIVRRKDEWKSFISFLSSQLVCSLHVHVITTSERKWVEGEKFCNFPRSAEQKREEIKGSESRLLVNFR